MLSILGKFGVRTAARGGLRTAASRGGVNVFRSFVRHSSRQAPLPRIDRVNLTRFMVQQFDLMRHSIKFSENTMKGVGIFAFFTAFIYQLYNSNTFEHQEGPILEASKTIRHLKACHLATETPNGGRSDGGKYVYDGPDGKEYFYVKGTFDRDRFLRELIIGSIAREIVGHYSPEMVVFQKEIGEGKARYFVGSKSMNGSSADKRRAYTRDLEEWTTALGDDEEIGVLPPNGLGVVLAFDALVGNRDVKLANIVTCDDPDERAYPIDHEATDVSSTRILMTAKDLILSIKDFKQGLVDEMAGTLNDLDLKDNPHMPLSDDKTTLDKAESIFLDAIQDDVNAGHVTQMFHRAAALSDEKISDVVNSYPGILSNDEKRTFTKELSLIRDKAKANLLEIDAYQTLVDAELTTSQALKK